MTTIMWKQSAKNVIKDLENFDILVQNIVSDVYSENQKTLETGDDIKAKIKSIWCCYKAKKMMLV